VLYFRNSITKNQVVLKQIPGQGTGKVKIALDDVIEQLQPYDDDEFDCARATWSGPAGEDITATKGLDVTGVLVPSSRTISNYFTPTLQGTWGGLLLTKGTYPAGQYPAGLRNIQVFTSFLNALDPANEGLGLDGQTVIRDVAQRTVPGFPPVTFLNGGSGYIEDPSADQQTAGGCPGVPNLRPQSVAVRTDADRLKCGDQVYIPGFEIRTVDDHGTLEGHKKQIDVWIGSGDQTLQTAANTYGLQAHTCLKILNTFP
jgi:3D (Asp-Asp-Asp) domain-containing protein